MPCRAVEDFYETRRKSLKRKDEENWGDHRIKRVIFEIYDEMAEAMRTGKSYQSRLTPPPGPPADKKGNFLPLPEQIRGQVFTLAIF